jgi:lysophospholipase L1-like esterase
MKRGLRVLALAAATALALVALPASAEQDFQYLALGDSYAFAFNPVVLAQTGGTDPSKFVGYSDFVGRALDFSVTNAACPGETSGSMISGTTPDNGCHEFYPSLLPRHVAYTGSQLAFAVSFLRSHHHVQLVTLQIGGNDILMLEENCALVTSCIIAGLPAVEKQMAANLNVIYSALREQAGYRHTIVEVSYFAFNYNDPGTVAVVSSLDAVEASVAARWHARAADVLSAFAAASAPSGVPCFAGLQVVLNPGPPPNCDIHPSAAGHAVYTRAVLEVVPRGESAEARA